MNSVYGTTIDDFMIRLSQNEQLKENKKQGALPYLYQEWKDASIRTQLIKKASSKLVKVNIDAQKNQVLATIVNNEMFSVPLEFLDSIFINVNEEQIDVYVVKNKNIIEGGKKEDLLLYQLLYNGKNSLFKRTSKVLRETSSETSYEKSLKRDEYQTSVRYFAWSAAQEKYLKVNLNFKALEKIFPEKKKEISKMKNDLKSKINKVKVFVEAITSLENE
ncbi:MAG: hypothetical protein AAFO07_31730 [Bacteroidota bacterium]